ncbi:Las1-like family protein, expressed [Zostera marina]|uniref:Las1-like family protein, expressed n=1 Tax=Zostera marina TaxID=29655 RepID=A0A0K9NQS1_ZOSMR|nr:Las1-like family protein, expressed [Zostera marina]
MIVPWVSWDQWNFVRESLFSDSFDSIATALRRVTAWRSRGCLPIAIQATASLIEIRQKDSFFSNELAAETLISEDMLVMLYSMAITRFVNGFVEKVNGFDNFMIKHAPQKKKKSIFELADAIGIPRMLVDIRHESSHREPPSLPLLRLASTTALNWLKSHYWETQRGMIPDVRKEIKSSLLDVVDDIKIKQGEKLSSPHSKRKRKRASKTSKIIARLYSAHPMEVVSVLLEMYTSQVPHGTEIGCNDESSVTNENRIDSSIDVLKATITALSKERPRMVLTMLKEILKVTEAKMQERAENFCTSRTQENICELSHLSSLVFWLVMELKKLKNANPVIDETQNVMSSADIAPRVSLMALLRQCLLLSASGNTDFLDSAMLLADMVGDKTMIEKLKIMSSVMLENPVLSNETTHMGSNEFNLSNEEHFLSQASEKLKILRSRMKESPSSVKIQVAENENEPIKKRWTLVKSWSTCPIGMLPCPLSSTAFLPCLDMVPDGCKAKAIIRNDNKNMNESAVGTDKTSESELLEDPSVVKLHEIPNLENGTNKNSPSDGMSINGRVKMM